MLTDLSKIKKEFIPANEVPERQRVASQWDEIFGGIPKGQALVLHEPEVSRSAVRAALHTRQICGKFKNITVFSRGARKKATIYIVNTEKPPKLVPIKPYTDKTS